MYGEDDKYELPKGYLCSLSYFVQFFHILFQLFPYLYTNNSWFHLIEFHIYLISNLVTYK